MATPLSRRGVLSLTGAAALIAAAGTAAPAARAATAGRASRPAGHAPALPATITGRATDLFPEGVAWDPLRGAFLVTSSRQGNVSLVHPDGTVEEFTPSLGMVSTLGVKVDARRRRVLVSYTDYWVRRMLPVTQPPTSGVAFIDLDTGRVLRTVDTGQGRADTFANDLTYDARTGDVYLTDSVAPIVQRVDRRGRVTTLVSDERFASASIGVNGIAWHPAGHLLVTRYDTGALFRVDLHGRRPRVSDVALPQGFPGTDGIILAPDGRLLLVQNAIGAVFGMPVTDTTIIALASRDGWRSAYVADRVDPWPVNAPTTVTVTPQGAYVVSGQVNVLMTGGSAGEFWLRRVDF